MVAYCQNKVWKCKSGQIALDSDPFISFSLSIWLNKFLSYIFYSHQEVYASATLKYLSAIFKHISWELLHASVLLNIYSIFLDKTLIKCHSVRRSESPAVMLVTLFLRLQWKEFASYCRLSVNVYLPNAVNSRAEIISFLCLEHHRHSIIAKWKM